MFFKHGRQVLCLRRGRKGDSPIINERYCPLGVEQLSIDGGSTDGTLETARRYPHISRIVSEPDRGIYDARCGGNVVYLSIRRERQALS